MKESGKITLCEYCQKKQAEEWVYNIVDRFEVERIKVYKNCAKKIHEHNNKL